MESLMQYVWQFRLWPVADMRTVDGERIEVLDPGTLNRDSGPDFFNAKVLIGGQLWSGNVEIHVRATDWMRHGHHNDHAYDSVVLHVVEVDDAPVFRPDGQKIPQMVMTCARDFSARYHHMVNNPARELPCGPELAAIPSLHLTDWITALGHERLFAKADRVLELAAAHQGNWAEAVYVTLARALGFGTNADAFEILAKTIPLKILLKHSDSLLSLEALLFGQAGLLGAESANDDFYVGRLKEEYGFLAVKYGLQPSANCNWKMARMRPANFPHRRIAALAMLIFRGFTAVSRILACESEEQVREVFGFDLTGYWARRYSFGPPSAQGVRALSYSSVSVLIINAVAPVVYAYGTYTGDSSRQSLAIDLLHSLKPERNSIVDIYVRAGIEPRDAFTTQALIQLRKQYCLQRKCLFCRIGHKLLSQKVKR